jgi:ABC-type molybdate transport system substrate-binding protein
MKKIFRPGMTLWLLLFCLLSLAAQTDNPPLIVFAAASLTNALQEVGDGFTKDSSIPVKFSFAASSALARQIENDERADVFFSADIDWMDYLQSRKLIQNHTRHDVLGNRLVLVAPADSKIVLKIGPHFPLAATLGKGRLRNTPRKRPSPYRSHYLLLRAIRLLPSSRALQVPQIQWCPLPLAQRRARTGTLDPSQS